MNKDFECNALQGVGLIEMSDSETENSFFYYYEMVARRQNVAGEHDNTAISIEEDSDDAENIDPISESSSRTLAKTLESLRILDSDQRAPLKAIQRFNIPTGKPEHLHPLKTPQVAESSKTDVKKEKIPSQLHITRPAKGPTAAGNKAVGIKRHGSPVQSTRKFLSLAEQVQSFERNPRQKLNIQPHKIHKLYCPKTPNLMTRSRSRKVYFPNAQQREEMELQEMKRQQIKANPVNKKILREPCLNLKVPIEKKPSTVPKPFDLTEVKKKKAAPAEEVFQFKAQPVPSVILKRTQGVLPKTNSESVNPSSPQSRFPARFRQPVHTPDREKKDDDKSLLNRRTKIQPFSFDERMKECLLKRERAIQKAKEEEEKNFLCFKAQPLPTFMNSTKTVERSQLDHKPIVQKRDIDKDNEKKYSFKANPATVIHKKPFEPKWKKIEIPLPKEVQFSTDKRLQERKKFDEKIKQREKETDLQLQLQKENKERAEKVLWQEDRKAREFKARPLPQYKFFEAHPSNHSKLTNPESPNVLQRKRKVTRKD